MSTLDTRKATQAKARPAHNRPPFECVALVLQGGGALGAYQAGVYEALAEADLHPDWVAGISIGAINAAIIAGNPPEQRVAKLRAFWEAITANPLATSVQARRSALLSRRATWRARSSTRLSAGLRARGRRPGLLLAAHAAALAACRAGTLEATSFYDTGPLKATLERLVDFDRINAGEMRLSVGAVNVAHRQLRLLRQRRRIRSAPST